MKLLNTLPKPSPLFKHDAPIIQVVKLALPAFVLLSSITVFLGVKAYLQPYLEMSPWWLLLPLYGVGYLLLSLTPDILNVALVAYFTRSFLKGMYQDRLGIILLVSAGLMLLALTRYSFLMSQTAAKAMVKAAAPEAKVQSIAPVDSLYRSEITELKVAAEKAQNRLEKRYSDLLNATNAPLLAQINPLRKQLQKLENIRNDDNTFYIDLQQRKLEKQLQPLEQKQLNLEKSLIQEKNQELVALQNTYKSKIARAEERRSSDRQALIDENISEKSTIAQLTQLFSQQLSGIAGYAVFIVLILTVIREILYHRNEIEIQAIISPFDFQSAPLKEAVQLPFVTIGCYLINWVRDQYERLPALKDPPPAPILNSYEIKQLASPDILPENPKKAPLNDYHSMFNEEENTPISLKKNGTEKEVYDSGIVVEKTVFIDRPVLRECAYCGEGFVPNHKKQKYCSEAHRRAAWEQRTGRKLMLKKKK